MPLRKAVDASLITANGVFYRLWDGGRGAIRVSGGFDSGTVTLSVLNLVYATLDTAADYTSLGTNTVFTAAGNAQFFLPAGTVVAMVVTGVASASTIEAAIDRLE